MQTFYIFSNQTGAFIGTRGIVTETDNEIGIEATPEAVAFMTTAITPKLINGKLVESSTKEEKESRKEQEIQELKNLQYEELKPTDWYFVRKAETGTEVPQEIIEQRQEIRNKYKQIEDEINTKYN